MQSFLVGALLAATTALAPPHAAAPARSPQGLENRYWAWRGQTIRYQVTEPAHPTGQTALLVHGLFVNADHWRKTLQALNDAGVTAYAVDLLGSGWSSKPHPTSRDAPNGEAGRAELEASDFFEGVALGSTSGKLREVAFVDKRHPVRGSCYNFYTWAEQLSNFAEEVIEKETVVICNSIGTISGLQACLDRPDLFGGLLAVSPNFRELHSAEASPLAMPLVNVVQKLLRERGHGLFDSLANAKTVKSILLEPYAVKAAVTDELVDVLLAPLLTQGAADVVFDTLSYSAGPLPEEQLGRLRGVPVWVCYGEADPWTPPKRVDVLERFESVERVQALPGVGHCPHDEAPERVNPFILEFLERLRS
jgi:pimeloyl-ACP methyl ester carboxylesterase